MFWKTSRRRINLDKTVVMAILNVTPDSFSDGGKFSALKEALLQAENLIAEGAEILDIGGESTRPQSARVSAEEEIRRVVPVIEEIVRRFDVPVSIDTSKSEVAERAADAGAEIINDVSGLTFDEKIGRIAANRQTGLVLMHLRGTFETMHRQPPIEDIFAEVKSGFRRSIDKAKSFGIADEALVLDVGIGFSKTFEQNLELLAELDQLAAEFADFPLLIGTSRKSFLGKILGGVPTGERLQGSLASAAVAVWNGARVVRVHDVRQTVETLKVIEAIRKFRKND